MVRTPNVCFATHTNLNQGAYPVQSNPMEPNPNQPFKPAQQDNNLDLVSFTTLLAIGVAVYVACKPSLAGLMLCTGVGFINTTR